jgi:hypothetical protein
VRVPGGDEAKAQAILAALTLERVNMQLEQKGLSASLNFVGAPRLDRKSCEAGKYRVNADCDSCPSNSSSPFGSVGIQACLCNAGYTGPNGGACVSCGAGTYKDAAGNTSCSPCPVSYSSPAGSVGIQACLCNAVSANGERSREGGRGAGPCSPSPLHLSFALSFSSLSSRSLLPASPMCSELGTCQLTRSAYVSFVCRGTHHGSASLSVAPRPKDLPAHFRLRMVERPITAAPQ